MSERTEPLYVRVMKTALIALILFGLLGSVALELHLRASIKPAPNPQQHVFLYKPLTRLRVRISEDVPGLAKRETLFTTNALGVRGDELDLADTDVFKIMTLGGSVTECLALNDEDAWPRRLQSELEAHSDKRIWVGNAGRSGAMTLDYIAHAQILLPAFQPDVVIVMPGGNDLQAIVEGRYFPIDLQQPFTLARYAGGLYTEYPIDLLEPLYIYAAYERLSSTAETDLGPLYQRMKRARFAAKKLPVLEDLDEALDIYRGNLRSLYTTLRRLHGSPHIVLMTHPFLFAEGMGKAEEQALWGGYTCMSCPNRRFYAHEVLAASMRTINQETLAFCDSMNLKCFDLEPQIPKTLENFYDDGHLKEAGARLVGRLLGEFMIREGLVDRVGAPPSRRAIAAR
jgi:lysophospholipase L1-like esterase